MDVVEDPVPSEASPKDEILNSLCRNKHAYFKSQQRGEPDLSFEDKKTIAQNLLFQSPSVFLSRFGHLLSKNHLQYFSSFEYPNDVAREVQYHLSYLTTSKSKSGKTTQKNRRYSALQKMIHCSSYFSMEEMQARNPLLFEQLVGRYQTEEEKQPLEEGPSLDSEFPWMEHFSKQVEKERMEKFMKQQELDEASNGDEDSSDEGDKQIDKNEQLSDLWGEYRGKFESASKISKHHKRKNPRKKEDSKSFQNVSEEEKSFYLQEFQAAMYHSFVSGNDKDFDYSSIDNNSDYDCVDMRERDEQDQYFDEESPDSLSLADVDVATNSLNDPGASAAVGVNPKCTGDDIMDKEGEGDFSDACDRLTEEDVQNLKSFASSWVNNHSQLKSDRSISERTFFTPRSYQTGVKEKYCEPLLKLPIKKNHKIKISLKTKEM